MATITALDSFYTTLIENIMVTERQPLTRMQKQRDSITTLRSVYSDVDTKLGSLQDAIRALMSTQPTNSLKIGRSQTVTPTTTGTKVLTASVGSSASIGDYTVAVTSLAQTHRVHSKSYLYTNQALGLSGTFRLGGAAARAATPVETVAGTVDGFASVAPDAEFDELGSGDYYVETRNDTTAGWQFRLVDADGKAVAIKDQDGDGTTNAWQSIPTGGGNVDTGRGLQLTFGADSGTYISVNRTAGTAAQVTYTAQGAEIAITADKSLEDIAYAINKATYAEGAGVTATVVDKRLVLSAANTGTAYSIQAADVTGTLLADMEILGASGVGDVDPTDGFKYTLQAARDASFSVNGLTVTRSKNTGLTDVINGVTLNLADDAEGNSAKMTVKADYSGIRSAIDAFISKFNEVQEYLQAKTAVTRITVGETTTYSRGALANDSIFQDLRSKMFFSFMEDHTNTGTYDSLREIGLSIDDNLKATLTDENKLTAALENNFDDVVAVMDSFMTKMDSMLASFTGKGSENDYIQNTLQSLDNQKRELELDISAFNIRLEDKQLSLINQFGAMQAQMMTLNYQRQTLSSTMNRYY